jgi:ABC-2 type transport system permease protein
MTRLMRIAVREYLAYVRTIGFWLSMLTAPLLMVLSATVPLLMARSTPPAAVAVISADPAQAGLRDLIIRDLAEDGAVIVAPPPQLAAGRTNAASEQRILAPYLGGQLTDLRVVATPGAHARPRPNRPPPPPADSRLGRPLDYAVIIAAPGPAAGGAPSTPAVRVWSRDVGASAVQPVVQSSVETWNRAQAFRALGVASDRVSAIMAETPQIEAYSTRAAAGRVSIRDQLPIYAGFAMGIALWSAAMTGAGILLNSVIEEKSSRILEVLLSSASVPQIMGGKILGVAAVTATSLGVWVLLGGVTLATSHPRIAHDVADVLMSHGLLFYFLFYFLAGYLMFATLFITVGAFCETSREAQTLLGPMMIVLIIPILFLAQALTHPDSPILRVLSWVPIFTPFLMAARAAMQPPVWEVLGTGVLLVATIAGEVWLAGRAFRAGALSTSRFDVRYFFSSLLGRSTV